MATIANAFMVDLVAGEDLLVAAAAAGGAGAAGRPNSFSAVIANVFFVENLHPEEATTTPAEKEAAEATASKKSVKMAVRDAKCPVRVSLLAHVMVKGALSAQVMTIASAVFCSDAEREASSAKANDTASSRTKNRKRSREEEEVASSSGGGGGGGGAASPSSLQEEVVASFPLRLFLTSHRPPSEGAKQRGGEKKEKKEEEGEGEAKVKREAGMLVHHLSVAVECLGGEGGAPSGRYRGKRVFMARVSGMQETELTPQQLELLKSKQ